MPATQQNRHAAIDTKLGPDRLLLKSFSGREDLGRLFDYHLVLLDPEQDVDGDDLVGTNATLRLQLENGATRFFNGYISSVAYLGYENGAGVYHASFVPWLWLLTRTSDCRIFQQKTVREIIEETFRDHGFEHYEFKLQRSYTPREYCVQYNETDFDFISRLMEYEGIYYFWKHENGKHTMVIVDDKSAHTAHPDRAEVEWRQRSALLEDGYIYDFTVQKTVSSGACATSDYNFKEPKTDLRKTKEQKKKHAAATFELFEFPGAYRKPADGEALAKLRIEEAQTGHEIVSAMSTARAAACGYFLKFSKTERADQARRYLITGTRISISQDAYTPGGGGSGDKFECHITGIPDSNSFRPARATPRPVMRGPQTALVVGPAGEEIYCDEHGRVKVHFYWDRRSTANEQSSKWMRVSQPAAGGGYGFMSLPRVGQEVIVDFIEGDPDRPIITGSVYNGVNTPPYALPGDKNKATWKTNSTKGGGGFNEIRLDDTKGTEQIFINAQYDMDVNILHDVRTTIANHSDLTVGKDHTESIGANQALTIGANHTESVGANSDLTVARNRTESIGINQSVSVGSESHYTIGGNFHITAGADVYIEAGAKIVLEAKAGITLKVGGNYVTVSPAGVAINGSMVLINSGGAALPGTKVAKKDPEKPKKPKAAATAGAGSVETTQGMGHASNPETWSTTTVHDIAAAEGAPFYGGSGGGAGGGH
jgi:type VI secretion system secreted protein VgrG